MISHIYIILYNIMWHDVNVFMNNIMLSRFCNNDAYVHVMYDKTDVYSMFVCIIDCVYACIVVTVSSIS